MGNYHTLYILRPQWRATLPRAHDFRNPKKLYLWLIFLRKLGARYERACHSYSEFMLAAEYGLYRKSRAATIPIATATQPRNLQRGDSIRGREIKEGERGCK